MIPSAPLTLRNTFLRFNISDSCMGLACAIVLLLPENVNNRCIALSDMLFRAHHGDTHLNAVSCIPHLTLAMGCVEDSYCDLLFERLTQLSRSCKPVSIVVDGVKIENNVSSFSVKRSDELLSLHKDVISVVSDLFSYDADPTMFYQEPPCTTLSRYWTNDYPRTKTLDAYDPHITLGQGVLSSLDSFTFHANHIAVCHLGIKSTCRKILFSTSLHP